MTKEERKIHLEALTLVQKYFDEVTDHMTWAQAKTCADIAVAKLIKEHTLGSPLKWNIERVDHWHKVNLEIENL